MKKVFPSAGISRRDENREGKAPEQLLSIVDMAYAYKPHPALRKLQKPKNDNSETKQIPKKKLQTPMKTVPINLPTAQGLTPEPKQRKNVIQNIYLENIYQNLNKDETKAVKNGLKKADEFKIPFDSVRKFNVEDSLYKFVLNQNPKTSKSMLNFHQTLAQKSQFYRERYLSKKKEQTISPGDGLDFAEWKNYVESTTKSKFDKWETELQTKSKTSGEFNMLNEFMKSFSGPDSFAIESIDDPEVVEKQKKLNANRQDISNMIRMITQTQIENDLMDEMSVWKHSFATVLTELTDEQQFWTSNLKNLSEEIKKLEEEKEKSEKLLKIASNSAKNPFV